MNAEAGREARAPVMLQALTGKGKLRDTKLHGSPEHPIQTGVELGATAVRRRTVCVRVRSESGSGRAEALRPVLLQQRCSWTRRRAPARRAQTPLPQVHTIAMEHEAGSVPRYVPPNVRTEAHPVAWHTALAHHASPEELQNAGIVLLPLSRAARDGDVQRVKVRSPSETATSFSSRPSVGLHCFCAPSG